MQTRVAAVLILILPLSGPVAAGAAEEPVPLQNPGFEQGTTGWQLPDNYSVAEDEARSGARSLRVENTDPTRYRLARQEVPVEPGLRYRYSAWIKTRGVRGEESGATLCMEWSGAKGWLGGSYVAGRKGDTDWVHIEGVTPPIPEGVKHVDLKLYLRKGITGIAWFDDVTLGIVWPPPLEAALLRPNYRGWLLPDARDRSIRVRTRLAGKLPRPIDRTRTRLALEILDPSGATKLGRTLDAPGPGTHDLALDGATLPPGEYRARVALLDGVGKTLGSREFALKRWDQEPIPAVHIDERGRTIVHGKPFFPLGLYFGPGPTARDFRAHIDRVAASPFNTIMCYGVNAGDTAKVRAYLDHMAARGLKILYSLKDLYAGTRYYREPVFGTRGEEAIVRRIVGEFRTHPALLGWYLNDELPLSMHDRLEARQQLVRALDPEHPTWAVLYQVDDLFGYLDTADVLGADPYPIPSKPVSTVADWARKTDAAGGGHRPVWMVPQAFDWSHYGRDRPGRFPTRAELCVMTQLCLIHGADGLIYYCYADILRDPASADRKWADLVAAAREVRRLEPALLCAAPAPAPASLRVESDSADVHWATRASADGRLYVLMANPNPSVPARVRLGDGTERRAQLLRGDEPITLDAGAPVELPPLSAATAVIER